MTTPVAQVQVNQQQQQPQPIPTPAPMQARTDELAKVFQDIFTDIANLAVSFGLVDVVALVEEVDGGKELVKNIRKLLKDFKRLQDVIQKMASAPAQQPQQAQQTTQQQNQQPAQS